MKKFILILSFTLCTLTFFFIGMKKVNAKTYFEDNTNAYIVATANSESGKCLTTYYTAVGDGNAVVTFDLDYRNEGGCFGVVAGSSSNVGILSSMTDYMLFGKNNLSSMNLDGVENIFETGFTYKIKFDNKNSKWTVDKKAIGESDDSYENILSIDNAFTGSNMIGLACYTEDKTSATAVIDNLLITDLNGKSTYVENSFDGGATIKDGSMKSLVTDSTSSTKIYTGSVYIQNKGYSVVRFISESGEILSEQNVYAYASATAPSAPEKSGYVFKCWSESLNGITADKVYYPIYEAKSPNPTPEVITTTITKGDDTTTSSNSENSGKKQKGCGSMIGVSSILVLTTFAFGLFINKRRNENENI